MSFLESKTKFGFSNPKLQTGNITENSFSLWSNVNFYRTSYNDMTVKVSPPLLLLLLLPL